jgi:hypothetical protein
MTNLHDAAPEVRFNLRALLAREWPYFLVLILAVAGVAYTNYVKAPVTLYWIVLAPFIGAIFVYERWKIDSPSERTRLIRRQILHWAAVLAAMHLLFVADVKQMISADGIGLAVMTILALGTFTAGAANDSWRMCVIGIVLAIAVPAIAWLEQSVLLLALAAMVFAAVAASLVWHRKRSKTPPAASGRPLATERRGQ